MKYLVWQAQAFFKPVLKEAFQWYQQIAADLWKWVFLWLKMGVFDLVYSRNNSHNWGWLKVLQGQITGSFLIQGGYIQDSGEKMGGLYTMAVIFGDNLQSECPLAHSIFFPFFLSGCETFRGHIYVHFKSNNLLLNEVYRVL